MLKEQAKQKALLEKIKKQEIMMIEKKIVKKAKYLVENYRKKYEEPD